MASVRGKSRQLLDDRDEVGKSWSRSFDIFHVDFGSDGFASNKQFQDSGTSWGVKSMVDDVLYKRHFCG